jgi:hypothetical protein
MMFYATFNLYNIFFLKSIFCEIMQLYLIIKFQNTKKKSFFIIVYINGIFEHNKYLVFYILNYIKI